MQFKFPFLSFCILPVFAWLFMIFSGCGPGQPSLETSTIQDTNSTMASPNPDPGTILPVSLRIKGDDIWVRDQASTESGKVIFTLDQGSQCKIISAGPYDLISQALDRWYEIESEGRKGYVFGSQTDLALGKVSIPEGPRGKSWEAFFRKEIQSQVRKYADDGAIGSASLGPPILYSLKGPKPMFSISSGLEMISDGIEIQSFLPFSPSEPWICRSVLSTGSGGDFETRFYFQLPEAKDFRIIGPFEGFPELQTPIAPGQVMIAANSQNGHLNAGGTIYGSPVVLLIDESTGKSKDLLKNPFQYYADNMSDDESILMTDSISMSFSGIFPDLSLSVFAFERKENRKSDPIRFDYNWSEELQEFLPQIGGIPQSWILIERDEKGYFFQEHCDRNSHPILGFHQSDDGRWNYVKGREHHSIEGLISYAGFRKDGSVCMEFQTETQKLPAFFTWLDLANGVGLWEVKGHNWNPTWEEGGESGLFLDMDKYDQIPQREEDCGF